MKSTGESKNRSSSLEEELKTLRAHLVIAERELQKLERMKPLASSATVVVHDVRNSLGVIQSTAQFALTKLKPSEREKEAWQLVERNVETIKKILKGYLSLARQAEGQKEETSLNELAERVKHFIEVQSGKRRIKVITAYDPKIPKIMMDGSAVESAVLNLAINAIEAMEKGGCLTFATKMAEGKTASLEIADTGPGIPEESKGKLFTPFFTTKDNGTGMGLYSAKAIVTQNGGKISCESRAGLTKMILSFPAA